MEFKRLVLPFFHEVILFAVFLSGIWIRLGLYPEEVPLKSILLIIYDLMSNPYFFWLLPFLTLFFSLLAIYFIGGWLGLLALVLAFSSGYIMSGFISIVLMALSIFFGFFAALRD